MTIFRIREARDGLYQLLVIQMSSKSPVVSCNNIILCSTLLHDKLGHPHSKVVKNVARTMNKE